MKKAECLAYLRKAARGGKGDDRLDVLPDPWQPFRGVNGTPFDREFLMLNAVPLGNGTSGTVAGALYAVGWVDEARTERRYVPVALKVSILLKNHLMEAINALAMRELIDSGCTPGIAACIDAFCITGSLDEFQMPPNTWEAFWNTIDIFVYAHRHEITNSYGKSAIESVNETPGNGKPSTARVRRGYTVGFSVYELSPYGLVTNIDHRTPRARPLLKVGLTLADKCGVLGELYVMTQATAALNAANAIHGDLHPGNFVNSAPLDKRLDSFDIVTHSHESNIDRIDIYGARRVIGTGLTAQQVQKQHGTYYAFMQHGPTRGWLPGISLALDPRNMAVVVRASKVPLIIDFGNLYMAHVPYDEDLGSARDILVDQAHLIHPTCSPTSLRSIIPLYGISNLSWRYRNGRLMGGTEQVGCSMAHMRDPTTQIDSRAPEQLNPFVSADPREPPLVISSELSDVFSLATALTSKIIGFHPLGRRIPVQLTVDEVSMDPACREAYRAGVVVRTPQTLGIAPTQKREPEYHIWSPYNTMLVESEPERTASSEDGHDPRSSPQQRMEKRASDSRLKYYYEDYNGCVWAAMVKPYAFNSSSSAPAQPSTPIRINGKPQLYDLVESFLKRELDRRYPNSAYCTWYGYKSDSLANKDEFTVCVFSLVARIEAMGVPPPEECKGTLLYDLFREIERTYGTESGLDVIRTGWLRNMLFAALTRRLGLHPALASDLCHLLMDSLAWDPSRRPPAEAILASSAFQALYEPYNRISINPSDFWSAWLPSSQFWPTTETVPRRLEVSSKINLPSTFDTYFNHGREARTPQGDACIATLKMARYQEFVAFRCSFVGFLTRSALHRMMPTLHPGDSHLVAMRNLNSGLLDYDSGIPCMVYEHGLPSLLHVPGVFGHFKESAAAANYLQRLAVVSGRLSINIPPWVFMEEAKFRALPTAALSTNLKRSYDDFANAGRRIDEIEPQSRLYARSSASSSSSSSSHTRGPPPPKRPRTERPVEGEKKRSSPPRDHSKYSSTGSSSSSRPSYDHHRRPPHSPSRPYHRSPYHGNGHRPFASHSSSRPSSSSSFSSSLKPHNGGHSHRPTSQSPARDRRDESAPSSSSTPKRVINRTLPSDENPKH